MLASHIYGVLKYERETGKREGERKRERDRVGKLRKMAFSPPLSCSLLLSFFLIWDKVSSCTLEFL